MSKGKDEAFEKAYASVVENGWANVKHMARQVWDLASATPPAAQVQGEQPEVVGHLLLCGHFSSEEMGDIDADWDMKVAERLQQELVTTTDDVVLPLMTVAQHERIVADLRAEISRTNSRLHEVAVACATAEQERDAALSAPPAAGMPDKECPECKGSGNVYDVSGEGPWSCFSCTSNQEPVGYANFDELDNMLDDRTATVSPIKNGWYGVPLYRAATTPPVSEQQQAVVMSPAAADVLAERRRQVEAEQWTPEHDDEHDAGVLAAGAAAYALNAADQLHPFSQGDGGHEQPSCWPWAHAYWKPGTPRRDLIKAGALILAEIERIDRGDLRLNPHLQPAAPSQGESE